MPQTKSLGPIRITPTDDTLALSHELNRKLALLTDALDTRAGFRGPVPTHNTLDMRGNAVTNVQATSTATNAATVAQIQSLEAIQAQIAAALAQLRQQVSQVASLTSATPTQIDAADTATVGTSPLAAHGDHQHAVNTAAAGDLATVSTAAAAGTSAKLPRADHVHTIAAAAWASPGAIGGTAAAAGTFSGVTTPSVVPVGAGTLTLGSAGGGLAFTATGRPTYSITNSTTDRAYDADLTSIDEIADCLATLIADLRAYGLVL